MSDFRPELPPIAMIRADAEKLSRIANSSAGAFAQTAEFLAREIDRAQVIEESQRLPGLVTMGSRVTFRDDVTAAVRTVRLVYPGEADVSQGTISVLTPIGAALIGLSAGQSIEWETVSGGRRSLTVLAVEAVN
ncbi:MAG: nucleoside diphosphate kinase regulator [Pseudorhodoplanes sp.]|uniref:nucleoside diphosphate kinase regulator n=1 Tax=Pseudorhodoplanes sp. TaxID=1934341 RepID=UPI003D10B2FF